MMKIWQPIKKNIYLGAGLQFIGLIHYIHGVTGQPAGRHGTEEVVENHMSST